MKLSKRTLYQEEISRDDFAKVYVGQDDVAQEKVAQKGMSRDENVDNVDYVVIDGEESESFIHDSDVKMGKNLLTRIGQMYYHLEHQVKLIEKFKVIKLGNTTGCSHNYNKFGIAENNDFNYLHTPVGSDDEDIEKFPNFKMDEGMQGIKFD